MKSILVETKHEDFPVLVQFKTCGEHLLHWDAYATTALSGEEVMYRDIDGNPCSLDEAVPDFSGTIKWDGCMNVIEFPGHSCDFREWKTWLEVLRRAHQEAAEVFGERHPDTWSNWDK